jgi:hypothetical protein
VELSTFFETVRGKTILNRPIPTQPVASKKQDQRHPALLPVLGLLAGLGAVAAYMFVEDSYFKPKREAQAAREAAAQNDPMFVPVDQFMDSMSIRTLDFANPATISAIASTRHDIFDREPLNLGAPKYKAVRELGIRREVPPYEEQITVWFIPDKSPTQIIPDYYYKILKKNFLPPVSYSPGQPGHASAMPFPGTIESASSQASPPQPPAPATRPADTDTADTMPSGSGSTDLGKIPAPDIIEATLSEDGEEPPSTQPLEVYNLMFSRKLHENQPDNSLNPYKVQSEVLFFRLVTVEKGTRMVVWLRTPLKDRASKSPEERKNSDERKNSQDRQNPNQPATTRPGNKQR